MAQIINETPGIGALLGSGLGTGLGQGLNLLAQNKLSNVMQRHQAIQSAKGLAALGIPLEQAQSIAMLPPELQSVVLKNYLQGAESAGLDQALAGVLGTGSEQVQQQEDQGIQQLLQQVAPQQQRAPELTGKDALLNAIGEYQNRQQPQQQLKNPTPTAPQQQQPKNTLKDILQRPRLSPEHKLKVAALQQQRQLQNQKLSAKEQEEVSKETKPYYDELSKHAKAAKEGNIRLDRMKELLKKGNLSYSLWGALLNTIEHGIFGIGIDLSALQSADSQEFKKLSADFVKNAKDYFGSRLTDADLKTFLKTVPTLSQTDTGKQRVIANLEKFHDIALLKKQAADEIIKSNGGKRPSNIEELVENKTKKQVDAIAEQFKKGI